MAEPRTFKAEELVEFFGEKGVAALAEKVSEKRRRHGTVRSHVLGPDYALALTALDGTVDRDSMTALRRVALAFALDREDFAGWVDEHAAAIEAELTTDGHIDTPVEIEPVLDVVDDADEPEAIDDAE